MPQLTIELLPPAAWGANARAVLSRSEWDYVRKTCYKQAGYVCEICGGQGPTHPVEAHEVWRFNRRNKSQKLMRVIALCPSCHMVKHWGRSEALGYRPHCETHIMQVNRWTERQLASHLQAAVKRHLKLGQIEAWTLDISLLRHMIADMASLDAWVAQVT